MPRRRGTTSPGGSVALVGVPEVIDTSTLRIEGNLIRLFGVEWARGGQSEDLVRYLGTRHHLRQRERATSIAVMSTAATSPGWCSTTAEVAPPPTPRRNSLRRRNHAKAERLGAWKKQAPGAHPPQTERVSTKREQQAR